jgi:hypothetical protein
MSENMYKTLFIRPFYGPLLALLLCSCAFFSGEKGADLKDNELSYSNTKIELNFEGLEELISSDCSECFRTDIYLSDVDLNNANHNSREQIVMVLKNHMFLGTFDNGTLIVNKKMDSNEPYIKIELVTLNGRPTNVEVASGSVYYSGDYPQVNLELDLRLTNGGTLKGSYSKEMKSFKYLF